jgi:biopolymer transport protein ExbD
MNVMFLLIPALLLAMETASMAAISVTPPKACNCERSDTPPESPKLKFEVRVASDGFWLNTNDEPVGGLGRPTVLRESDAEYDYAALEAKARALKAQYPAEPKVYLTAEGDIPLQVLVGAMDALRGSDCKLSGVADGEQPPAECLYWNPVVQSF